MPDRREFVAGAATVLAAGIAGCPGGEETDGNRTTGSTNADGLTRQPTATLSPTAIPGEDPSPAPNHPVTTVRSTGLSPTLTPSSSTLAGTPTATSVSTPMETATPTAKPARANRLSEGGGTALASFGQAVAVAEGTVLVGAGGPGVDSASAFFFERRDSQWVRSRRVTPGEGATGWFGRTLALDGDTALVGSSDRTRDGTAVAAVYVYERVDDEWTQMSKLVFDGWRSSENVCRSVTLSGDTAVVGATTRPDSSNPSAGTAYLLERSDGSGWSRTAVLTPGDSDDGGDGDDTVPIERPAYGEAVSTHRGIAVVAKPPETSCYVFEQTAEGWRELTRLEGPSKQGYQLGGAIAIGDEVIFLHYETQSSNEVTVYQPVSGEWRPVQTLTSGADEFNLFGSGIALDGDWAVVGAPTDETIHGRSGSAYLYERADGDWVRTEKLLPEDGRAGDRFGTAVDVSGSTVVVGAPTTDAEAVGSAYIFE